MDSIALEAVMGSFFSDKNKGNRPFGTIKWHQIISYLNLLLLYLAARRFIFHLRADTFD